jgi:hypothetical protein
MSTATNQDTAPFFGFMGAASALVFACKSRLPACSFKLETPAPFSDPCHNQLDLQAWVLPMGQPSQAWALHLWA